MASAPQPAVEDAAETLRRALARHRANDRAEAERLYLQILDANPQDAAALYLFGLFKAEAGEGEAAEWLLGQLVALRPDSLEGHLALAQVAVQRGRQALAIQSYRTVLDLQPDHAFALSNLATLLIERGFAADEDFAGAIQVCRSAIALLPDPAPAQTILGRILLADGRTAEALEAYRGAVASAPERPGGWCGLSLALQAAGDPAGALDAAGRALALDAGLADAWQARGASLLALNQPLAAVEAFRRGIALSPDNARLHLGLGDAYAEVHRDTDAVEHLSLAVALDPQSKWAKANLGSVLYRCGQGETAEPYCLAALALDPNLAIAHRNLAGLYADRGDKARSAFHRDAAFAAEHILVKPAPDPAATVLIVTTTDSGNVPYKHLLPRERFTLVEWFIEYAQAGEAARLPAYDVVFNIIGDADFSGPTDEAVRAFVAECERPVLNRPDRVPPTRRDRLPGHLAGLADVVVPGCARLDPGDPHAADLAGWLKAQSLSLPILLRPMGSHGGRGLVIARTPEDLAGVEAGEGLYATEFVDFAHPDDGLYRKYRAVFIDRRPYPYHLAIKNDWLVHYYSAEMTGDQARQAEEKRFLDDPQTALGTRAMTALAAIGARLDLDYAGVDFSILPDGRVLVFEANATMLVHPEWEAEFAYKNPSFEAISQAFQALVVR